MVVGSIDARACAKTSVGWFWVAVRGVVGRLGPGPTPDKPGRHEIQGLNDLVRRQVNLEHLPLDQGAVTEARNADVGVVTNNKRR
jgi:hypothetical protein